MRKYILAVITLAALSVPASAETNAQQQRMKDCNAQATGMTGAARRVHERLPERQVRLDQEAALRQRQTMRQQLHRQGQGLPPIGLAAPDAGDCPLSVGGQLRR